ncbi:MAG: Ethyl tert-butyl ether degradation EthD [Xanthobacteraceae bacterium]|nr:Ethyl tert-butyl ether degradation EthD [Xanthobacteraceae bacterium]
MVKLTVLYGHPTDTAAFERYYAQTHLPLAAKMTGHTRLELSKVVGAPGGGQPAFYRMANVYFDSPAQMDATMGSPEGKAVADDLANFATGGVTLFVSEVQ